MGPPFIRRPFISRATDWVVNRGFDILDAHDWAVTKVKKHPAITMWIFILVLVAQFVRRCR